jgi:hypothetical protein
VVDVFGFSEWVVLNQQTDTTHAFQTAAVDSILKFPHADHRPLPRFIQSAKSRKYCCSEET